MTRDDLLAAYAVDANLRGADLRGANLEGAYLRGADLRSVCLEGANLRGAELPAFQIPQEGSLVVWKKLRAGVLAKCLVPETAQRTASLVGRKCRASALTVLAIVGDQDSGVSQHDGKTVYRVGATVMPDSYDPDPRIECSHGLHFFLTREEAEAY